MTIYEKIAEIMKSVKFVQKDGKVEYRETRYKYISEAKLTSILRAEMLDKKLIVYPFMQTSTRNGNITHVDVEYKMINIENPDEQIIIASCGDGADTQDKGASKAMTMAYKYMLLRTFAIPTGDDPDEIGSDELTEKFAKEEDEKETASIKSVILKLAQGDMDIVESFAQRLFEMSFDSLSVPQLRTMKERIARQIEAENKVIGMGGVKVTQIQGTKK